jgi:uncharacterized damage-inducible protein DinB
MSVRIPAWFDRQFDLTFPVEQLPYVLIRLRGTPVRLEETLRGVPAEALIRRPEGKWSAQEHAGHLLDLESLWSTRVDDYLRGAPVMTAADLTNRRTNEANHNAREAIAIVQAFRDARRQLLEKLVGVPADVWERRLSHPRLRQSMRLVDHLYFAAEHDDHHLATIWELLHTGLRAFSRKAADAGSTSD